MTTALNVLLYLLLGGSLLLFIVFLIGRVVLEEVRNERLFQAIALLAGAVAALGAQASDVSFVNYTIDSLAGTRPSGAVFKVVAVVIPGGIAACFGWYFVRVMQRSAAKALRLMSFLGMLAVVTFVEIFAEATHAKGVLLGADAIPNASFVVGLILSILVFFPEPDPNVHTAERPSALGQLLRSKAPKSMMRFLQSSSVTSPDEEVREGGAAADDSSG